MARGDIFFVELPYQSRSGREQAGRRPVIVVQTDATTDTSTNLNDCSNDGHPLKAGQQSMLTVQIFY